MIASLAHPAQKSWRRESFPWRGLAADLATIMSILYGTYEEPITQEDLDQERKVPTYSSYTMQLLSESYLRSPSPKARCWGSTRELHTRRAAHLRVDDAGCLKIALPHLSMSTISFVHCACRLPRYHRRDGIDGRYCPFPLTLSFRILLFPYTIVSVHERVSF